MPTRDLGLASVRHLDKVGHLCQYLVFGWLLVKAIRLGRLRAREYLALAWMFVTAYGLLMELIQLMVPWRSAEWADIFINALGAGLGIWCGERFT